MKNVNSGLHWLSSIQVRLTTPTDVKAATMLISVGIMLNFPAYKGRSEEALTLWFTRNISFKSPRNGQDFIKVTS